MRVGIIGCGSIGTRHAKNIFSTTDCDISIFDRDYKAMSRCATEVEPAVFSRSRVYQASTIFDFFSDLDILKPDAVIICTPHSTHVDLILQAINAGVHVLVEKPLDISLDRIDELKHVLVSSTVNFQVAYNLRFHPAVIAARKCLPNLGNLLTAHIEYGSYLPNWRKDVDFRKNYAASPVDGGIIMDDIHELDLACFLFGNFKKLSCVTTNIGLCIPLETTADIVTVMNNGQSDIPVSIHMDYLQRTPVRRFRIVGTDGVLECDLNAPSLRVETSAFVSTHKFDKYTPNDMYVDELQQFLRDCQRSYIGYGYNKLVESLPSLRMAVAARQSASTGVTVVNS